MENLDLLVLKTLRDWRNADRPALLATVVRTWGSSPRPIGSTMALDASGAVVGSVSGGCIEDDLIKKFSVARRSEGAHLEPIHVLPSQPPQRLTYGISADEAHRFGLPCGGTLELLLEFNPDPESLTSLVERLERGELVQRTTSLATGQVTLSTASHPSELSIDQYALVNCFGPAYRMLLIGAGQLTEYLATMASFSGFQVTVCDPRPEYRYGWNLSHVQLVTDWPDDVVQAFKPDRRSCVIALTHDPKLDDLALLEALGSPAFYVGAIGSRRNHAQRQARLIEHFGHSEESLKDLRGPIGIYIGSKTPAEIAVSVMAEVLAVKNGVTLPRELEVSVAKARAGLAHSDDSDPLACAVLRAAPGSVSSVAGSSDRLLVGAVVLAAGSASRMGYRPKCLLEIDGVPMIRRQISALLGAGIGELVVVLGHHHLDVEATLRDLPVTLTISPDPNQGQTSSLRLGLAQLRRPLDAVLVALADQPLLSEQDYLELIDAFESRPAGQRVVVPSVEGLPGNPVIFDAALCKEILSEDSRFGCKQWQERHPEQVHRWETPNRHYRQDVDTPEDIEALAEASGHRLAWPKNWAGQV